ncbi:hypothetical protein ACFE04_021107 [Oxalis oulophora]
MSSFSYEVLECMLSLLTLPNDRNSVSLVCKSWYNAERCSRTSLFIRHSYAVSPEMVTKRFSKIKSVTLTRKPRYDLVTDYWGANVHDWLIMFSLKYPFLDELRLKRMSIRDYSFEFLSLNFFGFKNLTKLDIQENNVDDQCDTWLSCFLENFSLLEELNFANLSNDRRLLVLAPQLIELGIGSFLSLEPTTSHSTAELDNAFNKCKSLLTLSGLWDVIASNFPAVYHSQIGEQLIEKTSCYFGFRHEWPNCSLEVVGVVLCNPFRWSSMPLREDGHLMGGCCAVVAKLFVISKFGFAGNFRLDKGLEAIGLNCPLLEELRVYPANPLNKDLNHVVTKEGFIAIFYALLLGLETYESMRSLWTSACKVTMNGCRVLASWKPMFNIEVMREEGCDETLAHKLYVYLTVAGPRKDASSSWLIKTPFGSSGYVLQNYNDWVFGASLNRWMQVGEQRTQQALELEEARVDAVNKGKELGEARAEVEALKVAASKVVSSSEVEKLKKAVAKLRNQNEGLKVDLKNAQAQIEEMFNSDNADV